MPAPRYRSRTMKKVQRKTPGGKTVTHYKAKKVGAPICGVCGRPLSAVPRSDEVLKFSKSNRRPNRPYGGNLCPICMRRMIKQKVRSIVMGP
ncbi:MAG: 50S ribosomal protein L34e [Euryarchaeota archaeon]|nr:50S ribosomal protein L34e [Euryarchaeota archaeon]